MSLDSPRDLSHHSDRIGPWRIGRSIGHDRGREYCLESSWFASNYCSGVLGCVRLGQHIGSKVYTAVTVASHRSSSHTACYESEASDLRSFQDRKEADDDNGLVELEREVATMKLVSHSHLLALYDVWESNREM